jgi:hypothetical protein
MKNFPHREIDLRVADFIRKLHISLHVQQTTNIVRRYFWEYNPLCSQDPQKIEMPNSPFNSGSVVSTPKTVAVLVFYGGEFRNLTEMCLHDFIFEPSSMTRFQCLKISIKFSRLHRQTNRHTHTYTHIHPHQHIPTLYLTLVEAYDNMIFYFFVAKVKWIKT